ncbi:MAG: hypothetical protein ACHQKY_08605, partial [Terriglobia bacterium]
SVLWIELILFHRRARIRSPSVLSSLLKALVFDSLKAWLAPLVTEDPPATDEAGRSDSEDISKEC